MDSLSSLLFWFSLGMIVYTYAGYPVLIYVLARTRRQQTAIRVTGDSDLPEITIIIAAYNEARFIEQKIINTLEADYPADKKKIFVVTDGSTDDTPAIVRTFNQVRLFHRPERRGKTHAVNAVMTQVRSPIVVFTDANTLINTVALKKMVSHFEDPTI